MKYADEDGILEIVIYVLVMVVGLAISAYRNYTKRKMQQQRQAGDVVPEQPDDTFPPVFDYDEPEFTEPLAEEITEEESVMAEQEHELIIEELPTVKMDIVAKEQTVIESTNNFLLSDDDLDVQEIEPEEISDFSYDTLDDDDEEDSFDLKNAVIYSEIMNPKYI